MKYLVKFVVVTLFILICTYAQAEQKVVYIDMKYVLNNSKAGKGAQDYLKKTYNDNLKKYMDMEKALKNILGPVFGGIRETVYGGLFDIENVVNPNNAAFSSDLIQPHTDLPYYDHPPCIQTFH